MKPGFLSFFLSFVCECVCLVVGARGGGGRWVLVTTVHNGSLILQLNYQWIIVKLISTSTPPTVPVVNSFFLLCLSSLNMVVP